MMAATTAAIGIQGDGTERDAGHAAGERSRLDQLHREERRDARKNQRS
jgi:hypothetical protein